MRSRSAIVTIVVAVVVVLAAIGGAYVLRTKSASSASSPPNTPQPPPSAASVCHAEPCSVVATAAIGTTRIDLYAEAGGHSGRLKIGDEVVIDVTITDRGAALTGNSLQCVPGSLQACLVRGEDPAGGTVGEVMVGRSGKWQTTETPYYSDAGYLALADINNDTTAEVIVAQKGYYAQVFTLDGTDKGCTRPVNRLNLLPGWPTVKPSPAQLHEPC
ncbi:hypothetical protein [Actinocrispum wychmicini]|uniref:Uncharacterized protein n=1 Tax=Actinocrispum wychmicini TaxID=1213861 RepID=A0A4R2K6P6_9PSEU|nr:hypothetical protein [Actinocrispum wychmicini]TCO65599.1 hypothetical protein EV192_1011391 [Actinocrispum wychmicini]